MRYSIFINEKATECYRMLEANKKQVSLKSYSLKIRIDPVRQVLWNKEKIKQIRNLNVLTRLQIERFHVYIHAYQVITNRGPDPYNSLLRTANKKWFSGLFLNQKEARIIHSVRKETDVFTEKKVTLSWFTNSNMVKPEKLHYLHLVHYF